MIFVGDPKMTVSKLTRIVKFVSPMICSKKNLPRWPAFEFSSWILEVINFGSHWALGFVFATNSVRCQVERSSSSPRPFGNFVWFPGWLLVLQLLFFWESFQKLFGSLLGGTDHKAGKKIIANLCCFYARGEALLVLCCDEKITGVLRVDFVFFVFLGLDRALGFVGFLEVNIFFWDGDLLLRERS